MAHVTQNQIATWKKKHGEVFEIRVKGKKGYFRTPDRATLSLVLANANKDPLRATEIVAKNSFLGGDEELLSDDSLFFSVSSKLHELMQFKEATLKKL